MNELKIEKNQQFVTYQRPWWKDDEDHSKVAMSLSMKAH